MKLLRSPLILGLVAITQIAQAADWPQWRHGANRSGATDEALPNTLSEQWSIPLGKPAPAYEHQYRMCADFTYAPVAADGMVFVPSNVTDQVMAFDLATGALKWRHVADGAVRFAPLYAEGKVYFNSDDGHLYCVNAKDGALIWKRRGVPEGIPDMMMMVNGRMSSRWPARGAPIHHEGVIYFGTGIWPEEGVYQNAVDADTGATIWQNDALSFVKNGMNDHGRDYDLSLPPHGYSAVINGKLGVTAGRTLAAWFDLKTGEMDPYTSFYVKFAVPRGTWYLAGNDQFWVQGGNLFAAHENAAPPKPPAIAKLESPLSYSKKKPGAATFVMKHRDFLNGDRPAAQGDENLYSEPVITEDTTYASVYDDMKKYVIARGHTFVKMRPYDRIVARDLTNPKWVEEKAPKGISGKGPKTYPILDFPIKWEMESSLRVLIKAGNHLIAGEQDKIAAIAIPEAGQQPKISWEAPIDGNPVNTLVADGQLIVVTDNGTIHCFGAGAATKAGIPYVEKLQRSPQNGFAHVLGWGDGSAVLAAAEDPEWRIVVLEKDPALVVAARQTLNAKGLNGRRVQVIQLRDDMEFTPYWATRVVVNDPTLLGSKEATLALALNTMRPYTGTMAIGGAVDRQLVAQLIDGRSDYEIEGAVLHRSTAPEGAADWSHESGDADNSFTSKDSLVKWPLGVLWYSGDIDRFFSPETHYQHERNPYPLVKDGRLYIITFNKLHAIDVYTGDYLWEATMPESPYLKTRLFDNRIYGRPNDRNYTLTEDLAYCITGEKIVSFDVKTGEPGPEIGLPEELRAEAMEEAAGLENKGKMGAVKPTPEWTEVRMWGDLIVAKVGKTLIGVNRYTGKVRWSRKGTMDYTTYTIGKGMLYGIDCVPESYDSKGPQVDRTALMFGLNPETGAPLWDRELIYESRPKVIAPSVRTWMKKPMPFIGFNDKHDLLVVAYNGNSLIVSNAGDGSEKWRKRDPITENEHNIYSPNILDDYLMLSLNKYTNGLGYLVDILTGEQVEGDSLIPAARACNRLVGNAHLMAYRDASVEMYNIDEKITIPFNSMRAGCTASFIPANGVMSAPMLGHGCVCNYPMFCSLAMYHIPDGDAIRPQIVKDSWGADQKIAPKTPSKSKMKKKGVGGA